MQASTPSAWAYKIVNPTPRLAVATDCWVMLSVRYQQFGNHSGFLPVPLTNRKSFCRKFAMGKAWGDLNMYGLAILENVRRYRTIASLYRQTAAFRPLHSYSLLAQAKEWEYRAVAELEAYFERL